VKHFIRFLLVENQRYSPRPSSKQSDYSFDFHSDEEDEEDQPGVNFTNVLRTAFARIDPKSVKKYSSVISVFLHFWDLRA